MTQRELDHVLVLVENKKKFQTQLEYLYKVQKTAGDRNELFITSLSREVSVAITDDDMLALIQFKKDRIDATDLLIKEFQTGASFTSV